jgi:hypothetical protein
MTAEAIVVGNTVCDGGYSKSLLQITEQLNFLPFFKGFLPQKGGNPFQRVEHLFWL